MRKILLKIDPETNVIQDIAESYQSIPYGYIEIDILTYPSDLMNRCYKYIDGKIVLDHDLHAAYLEQARAIWRNQEF